MNKKDKQKLRHNRMRSPETSRVGGVNAKGGHINSDRSTADPGWQTHNAINR